MELPFAVESSEEHQNSSDDGSLVTASSQGDSAILQSYDNRTHESFASSFIPRRIISAVTQWNTNSVVEQTQVNSKPPSSAEMNDYTYVNVWEADVMDPIESIHEESLNTDRNTDTPNKDILTLLLNPTESTELTRLITQANEAVSVAKTSKKQGDLATAAQYHSHAAQFYYQAAMNCRQEGYGEFYVLCMCVTLV